MHNADVGMTKETYFDMCEALGSEPIESEIPVDMSDMPSLLQQAFQVYYMLRDIWDPMGGNYMGKDMSTIFQFLDLYQIEDAERLLVVSLVQTIDNTRAKMISTKKQNTKPPSK